MKAKILKKRTAMMTIVRQSVREIATATPPDQTVRLLARVNESHVRKDRRSAIGNVLAQRLAVIVRSENAVIAQNVRAVRNAVNVRICRSERIGQNEPIAQNVRIGQNDRIVSNDPIARSVPIVAMIAPSAASNARIGTACLVWIVPVVPSALNRIMIGANLAATEIENAKSPARPTGIVTGIAIVRLSEIARRSGSVDLIETVSLARKDRQSAIEIVVAVTEIA